MRNDRKSQTKIQQDKIRSKNGSTDVKAPGSKIKLETELPAQLDLVGSLPQSAKQASKPDEKASKTSSSFV